MSDIAIKLRNISRHYKLYAEPEHRLREILHPLKKQYHKKYHVLNSISLEVKKGEILGVIGKNGSGKSTLLKLIAGILKPNAGTVEVKGSATALLELGGGLNNEFTGMQNVNFAVTLKGFTGEQRQERISDIAIFADLGEYIYQPVKTYSTGMVSRLNFAIAVNVDTDILILDEILAVGDELFRRKCYAKMEEYFNRGKTIIYVSHNANSVMDLCSRAILLDSSNIILDSDPKTVITYYQKYLYSKKEDRNKILNEIQQVNEKKCVENASITSNANACLPTKEEHYLEDLKPESTIEYKNYPVDVDDVMIRTIDNAKTNLLHLDQDYFLCLDVRFGLDVGNVGFSFSIKNERGADICSYRTLKENYINAGENEVYAVRWRFTNRLLSGMYYLNIGVRAYPENSESYILNRVIDISVFKVKNHALKHHGGVVTMGQTMSVLKLEPEGEVVEENFIQPQK